jgi:hypothetical protein
MKVFPLKCMDLQEAQRQQFRMVDAVTRHFSGLDVLSNGDLGLVAGFKKPVTTAKVEAVIADFFDAEAAVLVRGAGTSAIRWGLFSMMQSGQSLIVHDAPLYPTTAVTVESMGIKTVKVDYNQTENIVKTLAGNSVAAGLVQYARQRPDDSYDMQEVVAALKVKGIPVITDDNYAVMRVQNIGVQCGANLSAFSLFKLLGPEGVGCVVGEKKYIDKIVKINYSGGGQVQGHEAMACLRGMIYAPVAMAIQGLVVDETCRRLQEGEVPGVKRAIIVNAQSKVLLVEFEKPISSAVLKAAEAFGAAPHPVGSESKYEFVPMFYKISGTFIAADPPLAERMIRINPMRSGADTIIRILREAMSTIVEVGE